MVDNETGHWGSYALSQLMAKVLPGPASDIARVIIQEIIANILAYSAPAVAVLGSQLDIVSHPDTSAPTGLTISLWADGPSIVSELRARLADKSLQSYYSGALDEFEVETMGWKPKMQNEAASQGPASADARVLLASLYSGARLKAPRKSAARAAGFDMLIENDYWLFALYRTAVDTFKGSVEVRTERSSLLVHGHGIDDRYAVRVSQGESPSPFTGNILTVHLPLSDG
jgi:hypothetical protein